MKRSFLTRQLGRRPRRLLIVGVIFTLVFSAAAALVVIGHFRGRWHIADMPRVAQLLLFSALGMTGVGLVVWSVRSLRRLPWHPDVLALRRYGRPEMLIPEIDAELADPAKVVRIGRALKSFALVLNPRSGEVAGEVIFTPGWLVCVSGEDGSRVHVLRLDRVVWAYRTATSPGAAALAAALGLAPAGSVYLHDRHDYLLEIPGTEQGLTRLMAEVIARIPWALTRFDEAVARRWRDDREQVIAEAESRRQIRPQKP